MDRAPPVGAAVCTWFVADEAADATFFPQIGLKSDAPEAKAIYWRCVCCFFASSKAVNQELTHLFFTNTELPTVDGVDVKGFLVDLGVGVIHLPITYRIKRADIQSWGNQFYILDIIKHLALSGGFECYIVLDSDCIFVSNIDAMKGAITQYGVLTYDLAADEGSESDMTNGCSAAGMAKYMQRIAPHDRDSVVYCGGEIFAATYSEVVRIADQIDKFWAPIAAGDDIEIREEAHFLSVIYAHNGYDIGTANPFIKRMWTTFKFRNTRTSDLCRPIWHLPSEKKTGFRRLFRLVIERETRVYSEDNFKTQFNYAWIMGIPRRGFGKFVRDLGVKLQEKFRSIRQWRGY